MAVPVGEGVSSPVLVGDKVYVFTRQKGNELVLCLDLHSGKENWRSVPYPAPYQRGAGEGNFSIGPRSTPTVVGGRIYTLGVTGTLSCLDAGTGELVWRKDCKPYPPYSGNSPLVADGLCIVQFGDSARGKSQGGVTAFDARTGEVKWCYANGSRASSSSPILVDLAGERQVVLFTAWELLGVSVATGKKLWALNTFSPHESLIVTPVRYKDLLIAAGNKEPPRALRLEKGDKGITVKEVWKAKGLPLHMSSPVLAGDLLFGMSSQRRGCFFCLDAGSGSTLWESAGELHGSAAVLNAGDVWLALTVRGQLLVIRPSRTAYVPIAQYQVTDTPTWAHPVFLGNRILIRGASMLRSFRFLQEGQGAGVPRGQ
jgi:outer membrane protein assembly factor BamB